MPKFIVWDADRAQEVARFYAEFIANARADALEDEHCRPFLVLEAE